MRKSIYCLLVLILVITSCKEEGCTNIYSFNFDTNAEIDDGSCQSMIGCLGYVGNSSNSGTLGLTLYDQYYDQKMNEEIAIQRMFFNGIPANVYILYEPNPQLKNAWASPNGNILFGYHMFYYTVSFYGELPVAGILAHEWAHRAQQSIGWNYSKGSHQELEADAFSGYYMALAKQWNWNQIQGYFANVYATGDYNFNSPFHHGTHQQRLEAAYFGVLTGLEAIENGTQYTYNQIHDLFMNEILTNIDGLRINTDFVEIKYPENLTQEYIESLFPTLD